MTGINFFDEDAVIRLGEAILGQLQMDYVKAYIKLLKYGPTSEIYHYGKGRRQRCCDAIKELDDYIKTSSLTTEHSEAIIIELRRQAEAAVYKGKRAKKTKERCGCMRSS